MPSYIELDKQVSFPASSNSGKVILGINNSNQLQVTNSGGQSIGVTGLPYQVYTALLTQGGGSDPQYYTDPAAGPGLTIGVTYSITDGILGDDDFTNVGAPSGETYPVFVATGTTPNKWENGTRTYFNNGAPVVTVLENTIGNIWLEYNTAGSYQVTSTNLFTIDKTMVITSLNTNGNPGHTMQWYLVDNSSINVISGVVGSGNSDNILSELSTLEIRVYN